MKLEAEIKRIAEYQNSQLPKSEKRSETAINNIVQETLSALENHTYDFSKLTHIRINRMGKSRKIKTYPLFSPEALLCVYIKRALDRKFHIKYPNRNEFMHSLFDVTNALKDMGDYTIFRFDFEDFFNSVSGTYVYQKCLSTCSLERWELDLLHDFVNSTKYTFAGLNTSNLICEILSKKFDSALQQKFNQRGLIYYRRYIDDGILIFNQYLEKAECESILNEAIAESFLDNHIQNVRPCKTKLNSSKTNYIAKRDIILTRGQYCFDFLGYLFVLENDNADNKTLFHYGLTETKRNKYQERLNKIVKDYVSNPQKNMELLRHQIKAFTSRTVYQVTRYKTVIWKSKGLISNYCELGSRTESLTNDTELFLRDAVKNAFVHNGLALPYFLKGNPNKSGYSLLNNLRKNKTLLFVQMIGISMDTLRQMCSQIGVPVDANAPYDKLVREYLIKVKVGH